MQKTYTYYSHFAIVGSFVTCYDDKMQRKPNKWTRVMTKSTFGFDLLAGHIKITQAEFNEKLTEILENPTPGLPPRKQVLEEMKEIILKPDQSYKQMIEARNLFMIIYMKMALAKGEDFDEVSSYLNVFTYKLILDYPEKFQKPN